MADEILISYRVEIDQLKAELSKVQTQLKQTETAAKTSAKTASKEFNKAGSEIGASLKQIAGAIGIAFGAQQIISFGKESIKAFVEAEVNANKLKFAIKQIGNEGQAAFNKLIEQSSKLQDISIFSDDSIQKAQTQLATLGLTSDQIESLTPKILDLASATGTDLGQATDMIIQGINGQTRSLRAVGLEFDATGDKTKNLSILTENLNKFQGATASALETTEGKTRRLENAFDDLKESIGEFLVNQGNQLLDVFDVLSGKTSAFESGVKVISNKFVEEFSKDNAEILKRAAENGDNRVKAESIVLAKISNLKKAFVKTDDLTLKNSYIAAVQNQIQLLNDIRDTQKKANGLKNEDDTEQLKKEKELREKQALELRDLQALLIEDEKARELAALVNKFTDIRNAHQGQNEYLLALEEKYRQERNAIIKKYDDAEKSDNEADFQDAIKLAESLSDEQARLDKMDYEKRKALREQESKETIEQEKETQQAIQQLRQAAFDYTSGLVSALSQIQQNNIESQIILSGEQKDAEIADLDEQLRKKTISQEQYDAKRLAIEKKNREQERRLKIQAFEAQKQAAYIQTIISTAQGIANALTAQPVYVAAALAAIAAATGAAQLQVISSQPTPKFAKGVVDLKGAGTKTSDSIHAMLSKGESVITADATATDRALFEAFNKGKGKKYIYENYVMPALQEQINKFSKNKEQSFAQNIANSMLLNSGKFNDANIIEHLKLSRKSDKENVRYLAQILKQNNYNPRSW